MKKLYKNWPVHNLFAHPMMQILNWLRMTSAAQAVHDGTLPVQSEESK